MLLVLTLQLKDEGWVIILKKLCVCCLQETHFISNGTPRLKAKGRKLYTKQWKLTACTSSYLYICKLAFKSKLSRRDKEGHCLLKQGKFYQGDRMTINIYALSIGKPSFIKEKLVE
jgi:hypothetical protein